MGRGVVGSGLGRYDCELSGTSNGTESRSLKPGSGVEKWNNGSGERSRFSSNLYLVRSCVCLDVAQSLGSGLDSRVQKTLTFVRL